MLPQQVPGDGVTEETGPRQVPDGRRFGIGPVVELHAQHQPPAPHVLDHIGELGPHRLQRGQEPAPQLPGPPVQGPAVRLQQFEDLQGDEAGEPVLGEGRAVHQLELLVVVRFPDQGDGGLRHSAPRLLARV